ncbi:thiamine-phosphate kinase [Haloglycomyces albus]|uniref:thiamine-phosphate kinase n=1 Tax=Haloglycomyces albus TaxID=526067 RepID=UPI00046CFFE1|nr:thiamine-phosphate kinase [Haloglycomyces albus]
MGDTAAEYGEFRLIDRISRSLSTNRRVVLGPGDDAAVLATRDRQVVACTDMLIEGRHFRCDWSSGDDVGHRAAAANMADIAAMGGRPTGLLTAVSVPADTDVDWLVALAEGLSSEAEVTGAAVIGGDTTRGEQLTIAVTALGDMEGCRPVRRSGAQPGDVLAYVGRLGWAAAGLTVLARGFRSPGALVGAYRRPQPPYASGPIAATMGATAMIDVSDGLLADVGHIAEESAVAIDVDGDRLDVPESMYRAGEALGVDPRQWVLSGGDDHALVATFPPDVILPADWIPCGRVAEGHGVTVDGQSPTGATGWDHFGPN